MLVQIRPLRVERNRISRTGGWGYGLRLDGTSRMSREAHVRFCESRGLKSPRLLGNSNYTHALTSIDAKLSPCDQKLVLSVAGVASSWLWHLGDVASVEAPAPIRANKIPRSLEPLGN